jgi:hypothetical protein
LNHTGNFGRNDEYETSMGQKNPQTYQFRTRDKSKEKLGVF